MDDRGRDATALGDGHVVPVDLPVRAEQSKLRRPAAWSLALGAASLVPMSWAAFVSRADRRLVIGDSVSGATLEPAMLLAFAAGVFSCVWLVRLQWLLLRARRLHTQATDLGLWVMWILPIVSWILPAVRISRMDKAIHGTRSWTVWAWAVLWAALTMPRLWSPDDPTTPPQGERGLLFAATSIVTYALWAVVIVRLTRGAEVVAHETGLDA